MLRDMAVCKAERINDSEYAAIHQRNKELNDENKSR